MSWKEEIKKQNPKLALETLLREINRDMESMERIPDEVFRAEIIKVKTSSYKQQVEKIIQMM
tara:strand:- start:225 stop:410 length:186 start_codon:yes stop_codon:yes gene_type:complete